jgi:hypothetical protein
MSSNFHILIDENNRVVGYNNSGNITAETPTEDNQVFLTVFDPANLFKIYNAEAGTFTADAETDSLRNPTPPE